MDFFKSISSAVTSAVLPKKMSEDLKVRYTEYVTEMNKLKDMSSADMKLAIENGELSSKMIQDNYTTLGKRLAIDLRTKGFNDESTKIVSLSIDTIRKVKTTEDELMAPYKSQLNKQRMNMYMGNLTRRATQQQLSRFPAPPSTLPVKTGGRRKTLRRKTRRSRKYGKRHSKA
jgi:hypothetical protein